MEALQLCHAENPYAKFWGACNDYKYELDRCFRVSTSTPTDDDDDDDDGVCCYCCQ